MKYVLDFDRTLFDTDAFVAAAKQAGLTQVECITPAIWNHYNVRDFLYPEVLSWLRSKNKTDLHILTAITPELGPLSVEFQKQKLHSGKFDDLVGGITFMLGDKGTYVKDIVGDQAATFVDDRLSQYLSVQAHAPHVHCVLMQRPGAPVDATEQPQITTIHTLDELDALRY